MTDPRRVAAAIALALLVPGLLSGCKPAQPSVSSWHKTAATAVGDVLSEVGTTQLTLQQVRRDAFVGRYPQVVVVYAEEQAGKATDKVTTKQPPAGEVPGYRQLSSELGDAVDLISEARIAVVADDRARFPHLLDKLRSTADHLRKVQERLKAAGEGS